jgi:hypothetical protein
MIDWSQRVTVDDKIAKAAEAERQRLKSERAIALSKLTVTIDGMEFQVDDASMGRIASALATSQKDFDWVLLDNTVEVVTRKQLQEVADAGWDAINALWTDSSAKAKKST